VRVLVVEDDPLIGDATQAGLRQAGFVADWVTDGAAAATRLAAESYTAVVLDLGLPELSGLELLRRLRQRGDRVPVLILTARDTTGDRITGLDAGADDYMVKPFDIGELAARLRALARRATGNAGPTLRVGALELDPVSHRVHFHGEEVDLSAREFAVLQCFLLDAGRVLSRAQLEERLYAWGEEVESNTIEVYVHHLRRKFAPEIIRTVRGVGYLLPRDEESD